MPRYIDADKLIKINEAIFDAIEKKDLAEVDKSKNCKHGEELIKAGFYCYVHNEHHKADYFCASGERNNK